MRNPEAQAEENSSSFISQEGSPPLKVQKEVEKREPRAQGVGPLIPLSQGSGGRQRLPAPLRTAGLGPLSPLRQECGTAVIL